jgi:hypothetical protein
MAEGFVAQFPGCGRRRHSAQIRLKITFFTDDELKNAK